MTDWAEPLIHAREALKKAEDALLRKDWRTAEDQASEAAAYTADLQKWIEDNYPEFNEFGMAHKGTPE